MMNTKHSPEQKFSSEAGIAIGPILFIIAILAILAAAIAAGSGSFTSGTSGESNRTKASALIQIGENLKIGMDRLIMENNIAFGNYTIDPTHTSANTDMFSPIGGGITAPSDTLSNTPGTDHWYYPTGPVPGIGTNSSEQLAVLRVASGVCDEINARANAITNTPSVNSADLGDFTSTNDISSSNTNSWPYEGKTVGCVNNTNSTTASKGTFFYQVLYVQ